MKPSVPNLSGLASMVLSTPSNSITNNSERNDNSTSNSYGDVTVIIPTKDIEELKHVTSFFNKLPQTIRKA